MLPPALWPPLLFATILGLHVLLPARHVTGYVSGPDGATLRYRLNGPLVLAVSVALWAFACHQGWLAWDAFWLHRWELVAGACAVGVVFSAWVVFREPPVAGRALPHQVWLGRAANPQWWGGRVDAKMFLYLVGAVVLELNVLSFAAHHVATFPSDPSPGVFLYVGLFSFFVVEYLVFEQVHLYTWDFVAEGVGFKLGWGCFVFYPYFYGVGLWTQATTANPHTPAPLLAGVALLFFTGWVLSRGANLQKYWFKRDPTKKAFGLLTPEALTAPDGKRVLVSGFWGLSRHINYLGELLMATALALSLGVPAAWGPWLYPLYYVALLVPRQLDDDKRCAAKYGPLWDEYRRRVPRRIIPFVY